MVDRLKNVKRKELKKAIQNMEMWALKIMGRLYYHMELATEGELYILRQDAFRAEQNR